MHTPWHQYTLAAVVCKPAAALCFLLALDANALELEIQSGPGAFGELEWQALTIRYTGSSGLPDAWSLVFSGLAHPVVDELGRVEAACLAPEPASWSCRDARVAWERPGRPRLEGSGVLSPERLRIDLAGTELNLTMHEEGFALALHALPLEWLPAALPAQAGFEHLEGVLELHLVRAREEWQASGRIEAGVFDTPDGTLAGEGLDFSFNASLAGEPAGFAGDLHLTDGELLLGPVYLPAPTEPVELNVSGRFDAAGLALDRWRLNDPGVLQARGQLHMSNDAGGIQLRSLVVDAFEMTFPAAWNRWLDGWAGGHGMGGLQTEGKLRGRVEYAQEKPHRFELAADNFTVTDPARRFGVTELNGVLEFSGETAELSVTADWNRAELLAVPLGRSRICIEAPGPERLELVGGLDLPVLDGRFHIDRLIWHDWRGDSPRLEMDARLSPLDLTTLTRALEWPELGGRLAGRFPGVEYESGVLRFAGGIEVEVFSGRIGVTELSIERPFGPLPVLAAQVELERLDLLEMTGAFNFGRMHGLLSGHVRDLRLLDWQVVAMDSRFYTLDDAPRRRINQRAVNNLTSLGGGGGATLAGPLFRLFNEFAYRRAGLACRLANNICRMDGIGPHEGGGYVVLEGRGLPRMDIIGHNRLVDWPRLVAQIQTALAGE